jgi:sialate O-acetylesterase
MKKSLLCLVVLAVACKNANADVTVPAVFSDHMMLQRAEAVPIWGKADPGEVVQVALATATGTATTGDDGKWMVKLNLSGIEGDGPFECVMKGKNEVRISDVVLGEVWLASGQSNMEWVLKNTIGAEQAIAGSENAMVRFFATPRASSQVALDDTKGKWVQASPASSPTFSAVAYFFARELNARLKKPVGILQSSWGGTPSEAWTSPAGLDTVPYLKEARERIWKAIEEYDGAKKRFVAAMTEWTKANGREDIATAQPDEFAGMDVSTADWVKLELPGDVKAEGLPDAGIVWLRKDVVVPVKPATHLPLNLPINGFDSVYWNGKLIKQVTVEDYPGDGAERRYGPYGIPSTVVNQGRNVLAIRLYQPVGPAKIPAEPKAGKISLKGEWLAKAEKTFPALAPAVIASAPASFKKVIDRHNAPGYLYNAMISPFVGYGIRGAIWYQGESNVGRAFRYRTDFPLMISDWRKQWQAGEFPFYFCQLANFTVKVAVAGDSPWSELREAQAMTLKLPNTGMAVLIDIGESDDIHPRNKLDVGLRLARIALARDYKQDVVYSGPVYDSITIAEGKAILRFNNADGGLVAKPLPETYVVMSSDSATAPLVCNSPESEIEGFAICGEDKVWKWADAKIDGNTVVVWSNDVSKPVAVRYAWSDNPTCNLYNGAGLPASPFRTDTFPGKTENGKY